MKKTSLVMLFLCMIIALTACGGKTKVTEKEEEFREKEVTESIAESAPGEEVEEKPQILSLQESRTTRYEGVGDFEKLLLVSEFNNVTFWKDTGKYPEMDRVLSEIESMQIRTMEDEADNMLSFAEEMGMADVDAENFKTQVSKSDVQIRRADSIVLSYLTDTGYLLCVYEGKSAVRRDRLLPELYPATVRGWSRLS